MQAPVHKSDTTDQIRSDGCLELPDPLEERLRQALGPLFNWSFPDTPGAFPFAARAEEVAPIRALRESEGWRIEGTGISERGLTEDGALLRFQELLLERAARQRSWILFRGSVVARGSQSVLIVGGLDSAHAALAVALTSLEFRFVSVGQALFDARCQEPFALPLLFRLGTQERETIQTLPYSLDEELERLTVDLFRPRAVIPAREPTHVIFSEGRHSQLPLLRPISANSARIRLCHALAVAPIDPPPLTAVAELLRHARCLHLTLGELPHTVAQLARLLPRWCME